MIIAEEIVYIAFDEKYLNYYSFRKVLERMQSHKNSVYYGGLYDQIYIKKENISKHIQDWI